MKRRRWAVAALAGIGALALGLALYNVVLGRRPAGLVMDTGCDSESTVADMSVIVPGAATIHCQGWDVGTGVTGYAWHATSARAAVLVMHGWGDYSQRYVKQFSALIPQLLSRGISVYAVDMWGNGRSPGARGATDINAAVRDHLAARARLRDQPLPVFVLGHSVGGLVTVSSILDDARSVHGMILIAPALRWGVSGFMRSIARIVSVFAPTRAVPVPVTDPLLQSSDTMFLRQLTEDSLYHHGAITWLTASTGAAIAHRNTTRYAELSVPVLVVNGSEDRITTPEAAQSFVERIGSRDKTLGIIGGGRHSLLDDPPSSDSALAAILVWLDRRLPASF